MISLFKKQDFCPSLDSAVSKGALIPLLEDGFRKQDLDNMCARYYRDVVASWPS